MTVDFMPFPEVSDCGHDDRQYTHNNGSKPDDLRQGVSYHRSSRQGGKVKICDKEADSYNCDACPDPGQIGPLIGQMLLDILRILCRLPIVHPQSPHYQFVG